jgi:tetratricopeptide (TPR) repeat protein
MRLLHPTCVFICLALRATAQHSEFATLSEQPTAHYYFSSGLQGQLLTNENIDPSALRIIIYDSARRATIAEANINAVGSFDFGNTPGGAYELRILNRSGDCVHSTTITLPQGTPITIDLRPQSHKASRRPVSLARLQHKVPKAARRHFEQAARSARADHPEEAIQSLSNALSLDPQFFEAANNLGALYVQRKDYAHAYEMFHRAVTIDPTDPLAEANLAFVLLKMNRFAEAEDAARASVRADSLSGRARFFLAVSLLEQHKSREEAVFHLTQAREDFQPASALLDHLKTEPNDATLKCTCVGAAFSSSLLCSL